MAPAGTVVAHENRRPGIRAWTVDRRFYTGISLAILAAVIAGFGRTYYFRSFTGAPALSLLVYVHGAILTSWVVLLVVQTGLVASGRRTVHRQLGVFGAGLAVAVLGVGYTTAIAAARRGFNPNNTAVDPLGFLIIPLGDLVIFGLLIGLALYHRRNVETHKRLMLIGTVGALLPAALTRLPGPQPMLGLATYVALLAAGPVFDWTSRRRIHPVYKWAVLPVFLSVPLRIPLGATEAWHAVARWLVQ